MTKDRLLQSLRERHAALKGQLSNCTIESDLRYGSDTEPIALHVVYYARGDSMRFDTVSTPYWRQKFPDYFETRAKVASPSLCFSVERFSERSPYVLIGKDHDLEGGQSEIAMLSHIGSTPFSIMGIDAESLLSSEHVTILADEYSDGSNRKWRRVRFKGHPMPQFSSATGYVVFDGARDFAVVECEVKGLGQHTVEKIYYKAPPGGQFQLEQLQILRGTDTQPLALAHNYRVTSVSFDPPDESLFTPEHFGISLDEGSFIIWYLWLIGGGVLLIVLGYLGKRWRQTQYGT